MLSVYGKYKEYAPTALRLFLGIVFLHAGISKILMGAEKFTGMLQWLPLPLFWAWVVIVVETVGGLFLVLGLFTRWASALLLIDMLVAFLLTVIQKGFGPAYAPFIAFGALIALLFLGSGKCSLGMAAFGKDC